MSQDHCPFTRTKRNDDARFNPPNPRVAICYQLHDDLRQMHSMAMSQMSDETWIKSVNQMRQSLDYAKKAKAKHERIGK